MPQSIRGLHGDLSAKAVDMANSNLHVMRFLRLSLEDDVPDHSVLSRFRTRLTVAGAWDGLLNQANRQIHMHDIKVRKGCDDEADAQSAMRVIEVTQPGVDSEARWVRKGSQSVFGHK